MAECPRGMMFSRGSCSGRQVLPLLVPRLPSCPSEHLPAPGPPHSVPRPACDWAPLSPVLTLSGRCPDTLSTHSQAQLGPAQGLARPCWGSEHLLTAPRPQPLTAAPIPTLGTALAPKAQRALTQLNASLVHTGAPLWQVLLSHTFFLAGHPRVERRRCSGRGSRQKTCGSG